MQNFRDVNASGKICRKWITARNGKRIFAKDYGYQAFCFNPSPLYWMKKQQKAKQLFLEQEQLLRDK